MKPEPIASALKRAAGLYHKISRKSIEIRDALDRLIPDLKGDGIRKADIVIEAVPENRELKQTIAASGQERTGLPREPCVDTPDWLRRKVEAGELGHKTGKGIYEWKDGKPVKAGAKPAQNTEMTDRLILPMVNVCVACLREGIVENPDIVDGAMVFGTGFAPFRGGPLQMCERAAPRLEAVAQHVNYCYANGSLTCVECDETSAWRNQNPLPSSETFFQSLPMHLTGSLFPAPTVAPCGSGTRHRITSDTS